MDWTENLLIHKDIRGKGKYTFDWTAFLGADTISTYTVTVEAGMTMLSHSNTATSVTVEVEGGVLGRLYEIDCEITTASSQRDARSIDMLVVKL